MAAKIKTTHKIQRFNHVHIKFLAVTVCSLEGISRLQTLLFPCPFKSLTGIDCPGCGFQRSLLALLQGDWAESYRLYPPTLPLLAVLLFAALRWKFGFDKQSTALKAIAVVCGWFVIGVYVMKLWNGHAHF